MDDDRKYIRFDWAAKSILRDKGKGNLVTKRLKAGWSIDYLFSILEI